MEYNIATKSSIDAVKIYNILKEKYKMNNVCKKGRILVIETDHISDELLKLLNKLVK